MRLWSVHPRYLDAQGLVALWREGLLAQKVLAGKTRGYRHHPQLERFRAARDPLAAIGAYLHHVVDEAERRGYSFDRGKILKRGRATAILKVTRGQLAYEREHLLAKLKRRSPELFKRWSPLKRFQPLPAFRSIPGDVEAWERRA